ncbi:flagellar hook-length control protein FliK [Luteibacter yeojuensis]|uniref:Flagellar hook-length control protein-like C-terminal domain-containing protein n=1 Tax=Luteibacter yeojuensis TaxID=345309 RepID=A0A0F3KYQ9_9GAMM|nr:flagellar hook-length control protein FliK [Luteibacter yeojuensis]KJV36296.1 hypothetical protein VI08_05455 [Luteibacter yeojuensis]
MNNASLLLNVARPSTAATSATPVAGSTASSGTPSSKGFDHAMDAAHADARKDDAAKKDDASSSNTANGATNTPAGKAAGDKAGAKDAKKSDDTAKKEDKATDDTSIAASVLALIGVPTQVTQVAAKALGVARDVATGHAGDALATLTGVGNAGDTAEGVAAAKDGGLGALGLAAQGAADANASAPAANPFAALMAAEGAGTGAATGSDKDDGKGTDLSLAGPMPFAHAPGATPLDGPIQLQATQPATTPQFTQELGEQIAWMGSAAGSIKEARIKLHPEELGSMDVRVNVDGGKVNVAIMAQHPAAVHAVQQTLANLDSMLAHHGLSLGQADVNQGGAQQGGNGGAPGQGPGQGGAGGHEGEALSVASTSRVSRGLVDETA